MAKTSERARCQTSQWLTFNQIPGDRWTGIMILLPAPNEAMIAELLADDPDLTKKEAKGQEHHYRKIIALRKQLNRPLTTTPMMRLRDAADAKTAALLADEAAEARRQGFHDRATDLEQQAEEDAAKIANTQRCYAEYETKRAARLARLNPAE